MYWSYKYFYKEKFSNENETKFSKIGSLTLNYDIFENVCLDVVNKHVPLKKKYIRPNHVEYMDKELTQVIMICSKLRNICLKQRSEENRLAYKKQRNFGIIFLRKKKTDCFNKLNKT